MAKVRCREVISDDDFERWQRGEEVVMPFLTIGKGYEGWPEAPDPAGTGQGIGQGPEGHLRSEQNAGGGTGDHQQEQWEELTEFKDGVTIDGLKDALTELLSTGAGTGEGGDEEVMLITLDEEGEEPVVLQAAILGDRHGDQREGGRMGLDKETITKLVKEYLKKKDKPKRVEDRDQEERVEKRDEL
jgi:hypothetical protein